MGILHTKINNKITSLKQEYQDNKNINHQGIKEALMRVNYLN